MHDNFYGALTNNCVMRQSLHRVSMKCMSFFNVLCRNKRGISRNGNKNPINKNFQYDIHFYHVCIVTSVSFKVELQMRYQTAGRNLSYHIKIYFLCLFWI